jgi:hypothetical protein
MLLQSAGNELIPGAETTASAAMREQHYPERLRGDYQLAI